VTGLLLAGLSRHADPSGVPPALVPALQHCIRHESAVELSREIELEHVLSLLAQAGLNPLIIKGTALAYTLYDAPHLRSRCDTDLLFPDRASAEQAWKVLERMGYHRPYQRGSGQPSDLAVRHPPANGPFHPGGLGAVREHRHPVWTVRHLP